MAALDAIICGATELPLYGSRGTLLYADPHSITYYYNTDIDWSSGSQRQTYTYLANLYSKSSSMSYNGSTSNIGVNPNLGYIHGGAPSSVRWLETRFFYNRCGPYINRVVQDEPLPVVIKIWYNSDYDGSQDPIPSPLRTLTIRPQIDHSRNSSSQVLSTDVGVRLVFDFAGRITKFYAI